MSVLKLGSIEVRDYQKNIAEMAGQKSTLVVLPTGMGKTLVAVLVAAQRLEQIPGSKVLVTAPTRPLNAQHKKTFETFTTIDAEKIVLVTGKISPEMRSKIYGDAKVIVATPQTIENDLKNEKISLENFSLVVFDEAHRAVKDYAYTFVAKKYMLQSKNSLILALTASPGGSTEKISEICRNLFIRAVEIRTDRDLDVEKYVQPVEREFVYVDFPEDFKKIKILLQEILKDDLYWLKERHYIPIYKPPKKMLLALQNRVAVSYSKNKKNFGNLWAIIRTAEAIKLEHAIELLETQGIPFLHEYMRKMEASKKRSDQRLFKNSRVTEAMKIVEELNAKNISHPKLDKLIFLVGELLSKKQDAKIIVFANFRSAVDKIKKLLDGEKIRSEILVGQAIKNGKGMSQDEQIEILNKFRRNEFNVLVVTSVGEEGLDVPAVDYAIFYEPVASEIRAIQRRGRVGRQTAGKIIFLITKDTRDETYFFAALGKERKMKKILYSLKDGKRLETKKTLIDWTKSEI